MLNLPTRGGELLGDIDTETPVIEFGGEESWRRRHLAVVPERGGDFVTGWMVPGVAYWLFWDSIAWSLRADAWPERNSCHLWHVPGEAYADHLYLNRSGIGATRVHELYQAATYELRPGEEVGRWHLIQHL